MKNKFILLATLAIGFASCEPEFENEVNAEYTAGEANFSSYVAVGNSLNCRLYGWNCFSCRTN